MAGSSRNAEEVSTKESSIPIPFYLNSHIESKYSSARELAFLCADGSFSEVEKFLKSSWLTIGQALNVGPYPAPCEWSCLMFACRYLNEEIIVYLLDNKVDLHYCSSDGFTPLMAIAVASSPQNQEESFNCAQHILDAGVQISYVPSFNGWTLLTMAVSKGSIKLIKLLIKAEAKINERDDRGRTPFNVAVARNLTEVVELLFNSGADPNLKNLDGDSCSMIAHKINSIEMQQCVEAVLKKSSKEKYEGNKQIRDEMLELVNKKKCQMSKKTIVKCKLQDQTYPADVKSLIQPGAVELPTKPGTDGFLNQTGGVDSFHQTGAMDSFDQTGCHGDTISDDKHEEMMPSHHVEVERNGVPWIMGGLAMFAAGSMTQFLINNIRR